MEITAYEITNGSSCGCCRSVYAKFDIRTQNLYIEARDGGCPYHEIVEVGATREEEELIFKKLLEKVRRRPIYCALEPLAPDFLFQVYRKGFEVLIKPNIYQDYMTFVNPTDTVRVIREYNEKVHGDLFDTTEMPLYNMKETKDFYVDEGNWVINYKYLKRVKDWAVEYRKILYCWVKDHLEEYMTLWTNAEKFLLGKLDEVSVS